MGGGHLLKTNLRVAGSPVAGAEGRPKGPGDRRPCQRRNVKPRQLRKPFQWSLGGPDVRPKGARVNHATSVLTWPAPCGRGFARPVGKWQVSQLCQNSANAENPVPQAF
jgi:hypothetical protein